MTSARLRPLAPILVALALPLVAAAPSEAWAQPTAEDLASARALYKEGRALREKGDLPKALEKLRAAHALGQTPITGLELARTYELVGRLVDAYEVSLGVARLAVASDETMRSDAARAEAAKLAATLEPRLAKLVVSVKGAAGSDLQVSVDGQAIPVAALGEPRSADPGTHTALLTLPDGREVHADATLKEGETRELVLDATPPTAPPIGAAPSPNELPPVEHHRSPALLATGISVAGLGLVFGTAFGVATLNGKNSLVVDCPNGGCGPSHQGELKTTQSDAALSTVAFVVAGVGAGIIVVDLVLRATGGHHASVEPEVGAGWVGLHGAF